MIPLKDNVPSRTFPFVNYTLIGLNIYVFVQQIRFGSMGTLEGFISSYSIIPRLFVLDPESNFIRLISHQFLHSGFGHIIGNMLFLYIFGDNVEDRLGHIKYIFFYLISGIGAAFGQIYFNSNSMMPMIGASGAIAGVLGAYFLFYPKARVLTLIPFGIFTRIIEVPAFFFLGFWFLIQAFSGTATIHLARTMGREIGGVAWWAHVGGFAVGLIWAFAHKISRKIYW